MSPLLPPAIHSTESEEALEKHPGVQDQGDLPTSALNSLFGEPEPLTLTRSPISHDCVAIQTGAHDISFHHAADVLAGAIIYSQGR